MKDLIKSATGLNAGTMLEQAAKPYQLTLTENLEERRNGLKLQLERVEAAMAALKANPGVEEVLNLIQKASY